MNPDLVSARLGQADVIPYLLDAALLDQSAVDRGRVRVVDASRRNAVFVVTTDGSAAYVVKQARRGGDPGIEREAGVLRALDAFDEAACLGELLPLLVAYDEHHEILLLEVSPGGRNLRDHHVRGRFSSSLARAAGRALAMVHDLPAETVGRRPAGVDPAWPLSWHRPCLRQLFELSAVGVELLRLGQRSGELCAALDDLRESSGAEAVIHGDTRWENWIVLPVPRSHRSNGILLVDWELAGDGDPCLDIGAFLAGYLAEWVGSIPIVDPRDPGRLSQSAGYPLDRMQPGIRQFWAAYQSTSGDRARERSILRAVRFAGVRLIQMAVEDAQSASALSAHTVCLLQLGMNVLQRPTEAATRLMGLPVPAWAI